MSQLYITVSPPLGGKTTWTDQNKQYLNCLVICPDKYRENFTGVYGKMSSEKTVWNACYTDLRKYLLDQQNVIFDATSISIKARGKLIRIAKECGVEVTAVYFKVPLWKLLWRNIWRERQIPIKVIYKMWKNLTLPHKSEGIKEIFTVS